MLKKLGDRIFKGFCHPDYYPDIKGDLEELYLEQKSSNKMVSDSRYLLEVVRLMRPGLMRPLFKNSKFKRTDMLYNYFKISLRNLGKHKVFTGINVIGLAFGLTAFLLINEYIRFERSYDQFFTDSDQLYRLTTDQVIDSVLGTRDAMSFHPSGKVLVEEFPEIVDYTTSCPFVSLITRHNDRVVNEENIIAADSNFLKIFDYKVLAGDRETMLDEPYSLVLTKSKAEAYFGDENPVGQSIQALGSFQRQFKVTGVIQDVPENTHYKYDLLMSLKSIQERLDDDAWSGYNYYTFLKILPSANIDELQAKVAPLSKKYLGEDSKLVFNIQPVESIHLYSDFTYEPEIHGSARSVDFMVVISVFIIIIAWVNYVNLSTARAVDRAKEVGLRKVIGAHKSQLINQFMFESLLVNFMGALLALFMAEILLPYFNQLIGKDIAVSVWNNIPFLKNLAIFFLIGTLISGIYPALVLSRFQPVTVLRGKFRNSKGGVMLRKGLVVVQFSASLVLIASTFIVTRQVQYMLSTDLGIDIDYVVGFSNPSYDSEREEEMTEKFKTFKDQLKSNPAISAVGMTSNLPGGGSSDINSSSGGVRIVGVTDRLDGTVYMQGNDPGFMETVGHELIYGRNFHENREVDSASLIVNEAFLRRLGIQDLESMLNEKVQFGRDPENRKWTIIGIVEDYHRTSLKSSVEPTVYWNWQRPGNTVVKLDPKNYEVGLEHIQATWESIFPGSPYSYIFLDERFERLYTEDKRFGKVFGTFSILAILVAVLGLFGLSAFMAMQRSKEVGVRKVLGASISGIVGLFFKDYLVLIIVSAVLGIPLTYFAMNAWLDNYANRIDFPWFLSILSIVIVGLLAFLTVGYQVMKVANMNPSKTLRYE